MHYTTITAGELRKMNGVKVRAETDGGKIIEGEITVEDKAVFILHNNPDADGDNAKDKKGYKHSWRLLYGSLEDNEPTTEINRLETIEEFTEGELVYVSDVSVEDAIKSKKERIYLHTFPKGKDWRHCTVCAEHNSYYLSGSDYGIANSRYIAKIPKEETVEMTMEEINKALGKKVKIIE